MNAWIRSLHRWSSAWFTLAVVANFGALAVVGQDPAYAWVGFLAVVPLLPLLVTGLWLFALPYAVALRRRAAAGALGP